MKGLSDMLKIILIAGNRNLKWIVPLYDWFCYNKGEEWMSCSNGRMQEMYRTLLV